MERVSVLIAGAGPAGMVAALRLAQNGVDVAVLESEPSCPEDMRASTLHPPTLEMLAELGLLETLEKQGLRAPIYQYRNRATGDVISLDLGEIADATPHPYRLQCEQFKLTRLIASILADHPHGQMLFQHRLARYEQDETGATAIAATPEGEKTFRCDYLLGADGAGSTVRKQTGIDFEGFTYPEKFLTLSTAWPIEQTFDDLAYVAYMAGVEEWCVLLRVPDFWRVLVPAPESEEDAWLVSTAKKNAVFEGLIGQGACVETHHRTLYRVHQRVARSYRQGRAVLLGDAAHLNNPLGGFGMNSGVHDAWNLAEKLRRILQEGAEPEAQLDHYDRQRRTVMRDFVQAQTIRNKEALELGIDAQARAQTTLEDIVRDKERRRDYLLTQSMIKSRATEAAIA